MSSGSFSPGLFSTPEETSRIWAPVKRTASPAVSGVSPPASAKDIARSALRECANRRKAHCPGQGIGGFGWLRIEEQEIRERRGEITLGPADVGFAADPHRFHDTRRGRGPVFSNSLGRFKPVELEHVGLHGFAHGADVRIVGVDQQHDTLGSHARRAGAARARVRQVRGLRSAKHAAGSSEHHEAHEVCARINGCVEIGCGLETADLDLCHGVRPFEKGRRAR